MIINNRIFYYLSIKIRLIKCPKNCKREGALSVFLTEKVKEVKRIVLKKEERRKKSKEETKKKVEKTKNDIFHRVFLVSCHNCGQNSQFGKFLTELS